MMSGGESKPERVCEINPVKICGKPTGFFVNEMQPNERGGQPFSKRDKAASGKVWGFMLTTVSVKQAEIVSQEMVSAFFMRKIQGLLILSNFPRKIGKSEYGYQPFFLTFFLLSETGLPFLYSPRIITSLVVLYNSAAANISAFVSLWIFIPLLSPSLRNSI